MPGNAVESAPPAERSRLHPAAIWGAGGFALLLVKAIVTLTPLALEPVRDGMLLWQWLLYAGSIVGNTYVEGYRAFHLQAAPRVVVRAFHLARNPRKLHVILAPLYCMSLIHATRRRLTIAWCVYLGIVVLVILVRQVPQPWRGMVDAGVVVALSFGLASLGWHFVRALGGQLPPMSPELPGEDRAAGES
jgi:hypothetical protein